MADRFTDEDIDLMARTIIGEAGGESDEGKAAVAHVIMNRVLSGRYGGKTPGEVVLAKGQFEPWMTPKTKSMLLGVSRDEDRYKNARAIALAAIRGESPDITKGSTHFFSPKVQSGLGRNAPSWAKTPTAIIGTHNFYTPDGPIKRGKDVAFDVDLTDDDRTDDDLEDLYRSKPRQREAGAPPQLSAPTQLTVSPLKGPLDDIDNMSEEQLLAPYRLPAMVSRDPTPEENRQIWDTPTQYVQGLWQGGAIPAISGVAAAKKIYDVASSGQDTLRNQLTKFPEYYDQANALVRTARGQYEKENPWLAPIAEIGGSATTAIPILAAGGGGLVAAGNALTRMAPRAAVPFMEATGRVLGGTAGNNILTRGASLATSGALQGGAGGALSSGLTDAPISEDIKTGATVGAFLNPALSAISSTVRSGFNKLGSFFRPGEKVAQDIIQDIQAKSIPRNALGEVDYPEYVPGSKPTLSQITGDANIATLERQASSRNPSPFADRAQQNADARRALFAQHAGEVADVQAADLALDKFATQQTAQIFKPGQIANVKAVDDVISDILKGDTGGTEAVKSAMSKVRKVMTDTKGNLINRPSYLYNSVRKEIKNILDDQDLSSATGRNAQRELMQVRDKLDEVLDTAAPGFKDYIAKYSEMAKPRDAMEYLQKLSITDKDGNITQASLKRTLDRIQKERDFGDALHPANSLSDDQIGMLRNIYLDLQREGKQMLGKAKGSDTKQNLDWGKILNSMEGSNALEDAAKSSGAAFGGSVGSVVGGWPGAAIGSYAGGKAGSALGKAKGRKAKEAAEAMTDYFLNPENLPILNRRNNLHVTGGNNPLLQSLAIGGNALVSPRIAPLEMTVNPRTR